MNKENKVTKARVIKILKIIGNTIFAVFLVGALAFSISNVSAKNNGGVPNLFKRGYLAVETESMNNSDKSFAKDHKVGSFPGGSLVYVNLNRNGNTATLEVGEVVVLKGKLDGMKEVALIVHRIVDVIDLDGKKAYHTQGDNPLNEIDKMGGTPSKAMGGDILGVVTGVTPGLGKTIQALQSPVGFGMVIVVPAVFFLIIEMIGFVKAFTDYRNGGQKVALAGDEEAIKRQVLEDLIAKGVIKADDLNKSTEEENIKEEELTKDASDE